MRRISRLSTEWLRAGPGRAGPGRAGRQVPGGGSPQEAPPRAARDAATERGRLAGAYVRRSPFRGPLVRALPGIVGQVCRRD